MAESVNVTVKLSPEDYAYLARIAEGVDPEMTLSEYLTKSLSAIIGEMRSGL